MRRRQMNYFALQKNIRQFGERPEMGVEPAVIVAHEDGFARRAVSVSRRVVVGVDYRFYQRALAISCDVGIARCDGDRGCRRHSLTECEQ